MGGDTHFVSSVCSLLRDRELGLQPRRNYRAAFAALLEDGFIQQHIAMDYDLSEDVLSTIAIAVSPDGQYVVTTHGDHTVKVFSYSSHQLLRVFHGHPRTPWTVKFHPIHSNIIASGCLGGEVRLWDIERAACIQQEQFNTSIISIAFHPSGTSIAVASGPALYVWNYQSLNPALRMVPLIYHTRTIKAVMFHPAGKHLLLAAPENPRGQQLNSTPCRLFGMRVVTNRSNEIIGEGLSMPNISHGQQPTVRFLSDLPTVLPRVHLYSDGGLDISQDGNYLFVCAVLNMAASYPSAVARDQPLQSPGGISDIPDGYMLPMTQPSSASEPMDGVPTHPSILMEESNPRFAGFPALGLQEHICLFHISVAEHEAPQVALVRSCHIPRSLMLAITSAKLSPTGTYGLLGYGVRKNGIVERHPRSSIVACELLRLADMESVALMEDDVDEVNIAHFHTRAGNGIVYGTKRGRVRSFTRASGLEIDSNTL